MGLEQKLLQLDEKIWRQYEKVTQVADAYLGLDKYDLVKGCNNLVVGGALASCLYAGLFSVKEQNVSFGMLSLGYLGLAGVNYFLGPKLDVSRKKLDQIFLQKGIVLAPQFQSNRPLGLVLCPVAFSCGMLFYDSYTDSSLLNSLFYFSVGFFVGSETSKWYFRDQIPKPPRKTPAKLQEWYNGLRESLGRKVEVSVKYEGIEERVLK